jgi:hypothetical protein
VPAEDPGRGTSSALPGEQATDPDLEIKRLTIAKLSAEIEDLNTKRTSYESTKEKRFKFLVGIFAPLISAGIALTAALIGWRIQTSTEQDRQFERIRTLLGQADPGVQIEAAHRLVLLKPELSDQTSARLVEMLQSPHPAVSETAATTIVSIGTERLVNDVAALLSGSNSVFYGPAVETLGRLGPIAFDRLIEHAAAEDIRISGRVKAVLAVCLPLQLVQKSLTAAQGTDVILVNALLDAVANFPEASALNVYNAMLSFPGDSGRYLNELNPRVRVLRTLLTIGDQSTESQAWALFQRTQNTEEKLASAALLLGSPHEKEALQVLSAAKTVPRWLLNILATKPDFPSTVLEAYLLDDDQRGEPAMLALFRDGKFRPSEGTIRGILERRSSQGLFYAALIILASRSPDDARSVMAEDRIEGQVRAAVLGASPRTTDRQEAIDIWLAEMSKGRMSGSPHWEPSLSPDQMTFTDEQFAKLMSLVQASNDRFQTYKLLRAVPIGRVSPSIISTLRDRWQNRVLTSSDVFLLQRAYGQRGISVDELTQAISNEAEEEPSSGEHNAGLAMLAAGTNKAHDALLAYFLSLDRAKAYKGWSNASEFLGNTPLLAEQVAPVESKRLLVSLGARYINSFGGLLLGWWSTQGRHLSGPLCTPKVREGGVMVRVAEPDRDRTP